MANERISRLVELTGKVDAHLQEFEGDAAVAEAPASDFRERMETAKKRKKRRNTAGRIAVAGAAGAGAVAAKQAVMKNKDQLKEAGKTAAFRGMRKTAEVVNKTGNKANRAGAQAIGKTLKKGAKVLRGKSMKFFAGRLADMAGQLNELERA